MTRGRIRPAASDDPLVQAVAAYVEAVRYAGRLDVLLPISRRQLGDPADQAVVEAHHRVGGAFWKLTVALAGDSLGEHVHQVADRLAAASESGRARAEAAVRALTSTTDAGPASARPNPRS